MTREAAKERLEELHNGRKSGPAHRRGTPSARIRSGYENPAWCNREIN